MERKTEKLQFNNFKKSFVKTKNTITPHLSNGSLNRLNNWIKNFLEGVSFVNHNRNFRHTSFYIYGIHIKCLDSNNCEIVNVFLLYQKPLTKHTKTYIEKPFYNKGITLYIDLYVTFNKFQKIGKVIHLRYDKKK